MSGKSVGALAALVKDLGDLADGPEQTNPAETIAVEARDLAPAVEELRGAVTADAPGDVVSLGRRIRLQGRSIEAQAGNLGVEECRDVFDRAVDFALLPFYTAPLIELAELFNKPIPSRPEASRTVSRQMLARLSEMDEVRPFAIRHIHRRLRDQGDDAANEIAAVATILTNEGKPAFERRARAANVAIQRFHRTLRQAAAAVDRFEKGEPVG
jgi:hypothetical protein